MKVGTILKNGTKVLKFTTTEYGGYVLCDTLNMSGHRYATWAMNDGGETFWGHYSQTLTEANEDFHNRVDKLIRHQRV